MQRSDNYLQSTTVPYRDNKLFAEEARMVFRLLRMEFQNQPAAVSKFSTGNKSNSFEGFLNSISTRFSKQKLSSNWLANAITAFNIDGPVESAYISTYARNMLQDYCMYDDPANPSILFDAIVIGALVLSMAMEDKNLALAQKSGCKFLYSLTLKELANKCGINEKYTYSLTLKMASAPKLATTTDEPVNTFDDDIMYRRFILTIGYKVLYEQSLPFSGCIDKKTHPGLSEIIPKGRFERYRFSSDGAIKPVENELEPSHGIWYLKDVQDSARNLATAESDMGFSDSLLMSAAVSSSSRDASPRP